MYFFVTGSSSGIGRALVERLLAHDHHVWGLARTDQAEFAATHANFRFSKGDIAEWSDVAAAVEAIAAVWSHLDGVVTCAGIQGEMGPALFANPLAWSTTVRTNLDGTYYTLRACHHLLAKAPGRAKAVCFSGGGATKARANFSAYGAAKTGIVRLVETIAEEMRDCPYDINSVAPGAINTRQTDEVIALGPTIVGEVEYAAATKQKLSGGSSLKQAVDLVEYLLSAKSDGITGRLLSAQWDPWETLGANGKALCASEIYTLRRILPEDRGQKF